MKKKLILIRHAAAEFQTSQVGDFDRKLIEKGIQDSILMGKWLARYLSDVNELVCSSAIRAKETAMYIAEQVNIDSNIIKEVDKLYLRGVRSYMDVVNSTSEKIDELIIVGHNPDIGDFSELLCGVDIGWMKKCSVVILQLEDMEWAEVSSNTATFITYNNPRRVRESIKE